MTALLIQFGLGVIAVCLVVDVTIRVVYATYRHFCKNRLLDAYTDSVPDESPPRWARIAGFLLALLLNLIIYIM